MCAAGTESRPGPRELWPRESVNAMNLLMASPVSNSSWFFTLMDGEKRPFYTKKPYTGFFCMFILYI